MLDNRNASVLKLQMNIVIKTIQINLQKTDLQLDLVLFTPLVSCYGGLAERLDIRFSVGEEGSGGRELVV